MQYRRLSGTDLEVSVICLGPMRAAAKEPGDDERSRAGERALRRALDLGVNFLHSSYEYGTRWMMGRALRGEGTTVYFDQPVIEDGASWPTEQ